MNSRMIPSGFLLLAGLCLGMVQPAQALEETSPQVEEIPWSQPVKGLEARITLERKADRHGTRWLVPYLELRNVSDLASPLKVPCGNEHTQPNGQHVKFELVDETGKAIRGGWTLPRSGPHADPGTISLPHDSSMRIGMECVNWGIPLNSPAMISSDSGVWVLADEENGKVFLRATLQAEEDRDDRDQWHGEIVTAPVRVMWNRDAKRAPADALP